jgi:hypothetical protein
MKKYLTIAATTLLSMMKASQAMMLKAGKKEMAMLQEAIEDQAEISVGAPGALNSWIASIQSSITTNTQALSAIVSGPST